MNRTTLIALALVLASGVALTACGKWQRVGTYDPRDPGQSVSRLFDANAVYREMDLAAAEGPIPFVGGIRFLAGPSPDSTLGLLGLSLSNSRLSFRRVGDAYEAQYQVEAKFRNEAGVVLNATRDETVTAEDFADTQSGSEMVVFRHFMLVPPGTMLLTVTVRDVSEGASSEAEIPVSVPVYGEGPQLSSLVPVFGAATRASRTALPELAINPNAAMPYGADALRLYVEAYGVPDGGSIVFRAIPREGGVGETWRDSVSLGEGGLLQGLVMQVETENLPIGELYVEAFISGTDDTVRTTALVTFSDAWAMANFDETLSLLRYFGAESALREMRDATPEDRLDLWRRFWSTTDPDPTTQNNEAFDLYFARIQAANAYFRERDNPGWLTDRGEVFVTIGAPDEIWDSSSDVEGGGRYFRWTYISGRAVLVFVDESGFGVFRLTARSRSDFMQVVNRMRRSG